MNREIAAEECMKAVIQIIMYSICPMLAFLGWVMGIPILLYGGMMTSVDEAQGIFQTVVIFSLPMILFFGVIPVGLQVRKGTNIEELGLKLELNKKNIICLIVNIIVALSTFGKMISLQGELIGTIPMIFQLCAIGIAEEILCRGVLYCTVQQAFKNKMCTVITSSLIFAFLFHSGDSDLANLLVRFPLGLMLGVTRCYTGNVYNSIVMHIWYNSLMLIL